MIISKPGQYRLTKRLWVRNTITISALPEGTVVEITQIDPEYHKVYGEQLLDWTYWDLPVEELR